MQPTKCIKGDEVFRGLIVIMSDSDSFRVYSPCNHDTCGEDGHVLLHPDRSSWVVVNNTGLEIARHLDKGETIVEVARRLVRRYGISGKRAKEDVLSVSEKLAQHNLLNVKTSEPAGRSPTLKSVFFHLNSRCNLACLQCYVACPDPDSNNSSTKEDLPASLVIRLIDELVDCGGKTVTISGGEPLLHPEIKEILEYAASKVSIRLLTNGTMINREWAAFLADMDIFIQVSVDGSRREIHDAIRGKGNFDRVAKTVEYLQEAGFGERINFSTTVMKLNIHDLGGVVSLAERLGVPLVRFLPLRRVGSAQRQWDSIGSGLSTKDYERFYQYVSDLQANRRCSIEISCGLSGFLLKVPEEFSDDDTWCPVGRMLAVAANGDTFPCVVMMTNEFKLGNVFYDSLSKMIHSERMAKVCDSLANRRVKIKKCAACNWRNLCQSGCMGQALDHKGSIWDTDNFCDYRKRRYEEVFDKILKM